MKYLLSLLMLITSPAWAQWSLVAETEGAQFLVDFENIRKDNDRIKVWVLTNFSKPQKIKGHDIRSFRSRYELDCKQEQIRNLTISAFSSPNARGTLFGTEDSPGGWYDPAPRTSDWEILKSVCKASR